MSIPGNHSRPSSSSPKTSTTLARGKRKRESATSAAADVVSDGDSSRAHTEQLHQLFRDTIELLKWYVTSCMNIWLAYPLLTRLMDSHDVTPSILNHPIPPPSADSPVAKKPRLATSMEKTSIARLVELNAYNSVDELSQDLEAVIASVVGEMEAKTSGDEDFDKTKVRIRHQPDLVRVMAFKQEFNNIILREVLQRPGLMDRKNRQSRIEDETASKPLNTFGTDNDQDDRSYDTILTLFGGSNQPKQLFSSLKGYDKHLASQLGHLKSRVSEVGLPNGINFTKIVPVHTKGSREGTKDVPTFKDLFAPPSSTQSLNPPRQSRHTATRSSSVNWYNPSEATTPSRPNRRDSYSQQPLTAGQWLTYNIAPSTKDMSSPDSKRKQRDRALSFGEPQNEPSEQTVALHRQAKEDALFRSVYSSFAPDRDNSGALVPESSKNQMWWKRVGERRYNESISWSRQNSSSEDDENLADGDVEGDQGVSLLEAVESWAPEETPAELLEREQRDADDNNAAPDIDEILGEISQLLETLNSYQDVRNLTLPTNARTSASQNPQLSAMTGTPSSPSSEEVEIYNMLKSQLSIMVSSLPPYALAKLDGQKLGKLGFNTKIQVETRNYQGSLEEDEISTKGRVPAVNVGASYPSRTPNAAIGLAPRNNYMAATGTPAALSHRPSHMPQTVPTRSTAPSYLPNQQYSARPPSANQYYSSNTRTSYPSQRAITASTPDRYSYSATPQYGQQSTRQPYVNGYNQYSGQNGTAYGQGYGQMQQGATNPRISQSSYQQSSRPSKSYSYAPSPTPTGSASPSKAAMQYTSSNYTHPNNTPSQARPSLPPQHSSQFNSQTPSSPQINGTGNSQALQANNQAVGDVSRQKVQLAEAARVNNGTLQPAIVNQTEAGQESGASVVQDL